LYFPGGRLAEETEPLLPYATDGDPDEGGGSGTATAEETAGTEATAGIEVEGAELVPGGVPRARHAIRAMASKHPAASRAMA
jgi:hypothetical protein